MWSGYVRIPETVFRLTNNFCSVFRADHISFIAQSFTHLLIETGTVDQTHLALSANLFTIGENPNVCGNSGVIEQLVRQANNGLQQIVFDDPAADLAFTTASIAGKHGRPIKDDPDAAAAILRSIHFGDQML